jgi:6,7-dimethyl-8-ribityllumazine synthase
MTSNPQQAFDQPYPINNASTLRVVIVQATWNARITGELLTGCASVLHENGLVDKNVTVLKVPGSFELIGGAKLALENLKPDAVICLGCVIKGDTPHFEYISQAVTNGLTTLQTQTSTPVVFGVLTVLTEEQANQRIGGSHGHKGKEAAQTALQMIALRQYIAAR